MRVFKVTWNLLVGTLTLMPSPFFTRHHRDHHSQKMYGTPEDPEYVVNVFRPGSLPSILCYLLIVAAFPIIVFLRFFLSPLTFLHPKLREWTLTRASSLTMNWRYERKLTGFDRWAMTSIELLVLSAGGRDSWSSCSWASLPGAACRCSIPSAWACSF